MLSVNKAHDSSLRLIKSYLSSSLRSVVSLYFGDLAMADVNRRTAGTYFFTMRLRAQHRPYLIDYSDLWAEALKALHQKHSVRIHAYVLLPDHLHMIWTLVAVPGHVRCCNFLAQHFSVALANRTGASDRLQQTEFRLFRSYYPTTSIHTLAELRHWQSRVQNDPVRHGLVQGSADWCYSSATRRVGAGAP